MRTREIETERLLLRRWRASDLEPFAAMNADARVMEHFASVSSRQESEAMMARIRAHFDHPRLAEGHPMRRHVLYRLRRSNWEELLSRGAS